MDNSLLRLLLFFVIIMTYGCGDLCNHRFPASEISKLGKYSVSLCPDVKYKKLFFYVSHKDLFASLRSKRIRIWIDGSGYIYDGSFTSPIVVDSFPYCQSKNLSAAIGILIVDTSKSIAYSWMNEETYSIDKLGGNIEIKLKRKVISGVDKGAYEIYFK